jgi:hypothetical protein
MVLDALGTCTASHSALFPYTWEVVPHGDNGIIWNGAATNDPELGWVLMATRSACKWSKCGIFDQKPEPVVVVLGLGPEPVFVQDATVGIWAFDEQSFVNKTNSSPAATFVRQDYRPFTFRGSVYTGLALRTSDWGAHIEFEAIAELDFNAKAVKLVRFFDKPILHHDAPVQTEKNWGYFQHKGKLMLLYTVLPCTRIFDLGDLTVSQPKLVFEECYDGLGHDLELAAYLNIAATHNSGHPALWSHGDRTEYLLMVHNRDTPEVGGYNHWLLRMDPATLKLTHISKGIVFGSYSYHDRGEMSHTIIVGSFHVVMQHYLVVVGGQADESVIYDRIDLRNIRWHELDRS